MGPRTLVKVLAVLGAGAVSAAPAAAAAGTPASPAKSTARLSAYRHDVSAPSAPHDLAGKPGNAQVALSWGASSDNVGVRGYRVYRAGREVATTTALRYTDPRLTNGRTYSYDVVAFDAAGNLSKRSATVSATPAASTPVARAATTTTTASLYWGGLIGSQFTGTQAPWSWNAVTDFQTTNAAGKGISVLHFGTGHWYSSTGCGGYCAFPASPLTATRNSGVIPFYDWGTGSDTNASSFTDAQIAAGAQDAYITQWAQAAKAWGHPFFLRFDWEMNGRWFPWGVGAAGTTAAAYVAMWRHVHNLFTTVGATNVTWVWCPNVDQYTNLAPLPSLYPGGSYVDWTCLDGYNGDNPWTSFHNLFASTYASITGSIAPTKPVIVGETGSTETGGSKAQWISNMLSDLPVSFPRIRGVLWYDRDDAGPGGHTDWPIESSSTSKAAFAQGIASARFVANKYAALSTSGAIAPPS